MSAGTDVARPAPFLVRHVLPGIGVLPRDLATDSASGLVGSALGFARASARAGAAVELWGVANARPGPARYPLRGVRLRGLRAWPVGRVGPIDVRYQLAAGAAALRASRCDVLHVHALPTLLLLPRGRRKVLHLHMAIGASNPVERLLLRRADAVLCASAYLAARFRATHPEYVGAVHVIHNGADPTLYADATPGVVLRREWGIGDEEVVVLFAGQVAPQKGLDCLITSLALLPERDRPRLVIAGSGTLWRSVDTAGKEDRSPYERRLRTASDNLPVVWLGKTPVKRMPATLLAADIVCCPSVVPEGLATINLEAAAAGKPVVATAVGGIPEVVRDGVTGLLVPYDSHRDDAAARAALATALAQALARLIADRALRRRLGEAARQGVHTWDQAGAEVEALYRRT